MAEYLFVYGSLRAGNENRFARMVQARCVGMGDGFVRARVFRLACYRALKEAVGPQDRVWGEVYRFKPGARLLPVLDRYEGRRFKRRLTRVELANGRVVEAWCYWGLKGQA